MLTNRAIQRKGRSNLFAAVVFFLCLDGAMLGLNLSITQQVDQQASAINLAGRQRMLSQRIGKALLHLADLQYEEQSDFYRIVASNSFNLFATTLMAFNDGGVVQGADIEEVELSAVPKGEARLLVSRTLTAIRPFTVTLASVLDEPHGSAGINRLASDWSAISENLLTDMNSLVVILEDYSGKQTARLRVVQALLFFIAALNFLYIVHIFRSQHKSALRTISALETLLENVATPMMIADGSERLIHVNLAAQRDFNLKPQGGTGMVWRNLIETREGVEYLRINGGKFCPIQVDLHELEFDNERYQVISLFDISRYRDRELELSLIAQRDPLTGLLNRRALYDRLEQEISRAKRTQAPLALMFIDLDGFKHINDQYGHDAGDRALTHITRMLLANVRDSDVLLRVGGDEFVLIAPDHLSTETITGQAAKLVEVMSTPFTEADHSLNLGGSIGVAIYPNDAQGVDELLSLADSAMYKAKQRSTGYQLAEVEVSE